MCERGGVCSVPLLGVLQEQVECVEHVYRREHPVNEEHCGRTRPHRAVVWAERMRRWPPLVVVVVVVVAVYMLAHHTATTM